MPNSIRKHIRREKARIRREFLDIKEQKEQINKLYDKFIIQKKDDNKRDIQSGN